MAPCTNPGVQQGMDGGTAGAWGSPWPCLQVGPKRSILLPGPCSILLPVPQRPALGSPGGDTGLWQPHPRMTALTGGDGCIPVEPVSALPPSAIEVLLFQNLFLPGTPHLGRGELEAPKPSPHPAPSFPQDETTLNGPSPVLREHLLVCSGCLEPSSRPGPSTRCYLEVGVPWPTWSRELVA